MKSPLITIVFLLTVASSTYAQDWPAEGATWSYRHFNVQLEGYVHLQYGKDTIIDEVTFHKLNGEVEVYQPFYSPDVVSFMIPPKLVARQNDSFYLQRDTFLMFLYDLGAEPNDEWSTHLPNGDSIYTLVTDTGHIEINGIKLRYLDVEKLYDFPNSFESTYDRIIERIGTTHDYIDPYDIVLSHLDAHQGGAFRCYSDSEIHLRTNGYLNDTLCEFTTSVAEIEHPPNKQVQTVVVVKHVLSIDPKLIGLKYSIIDFNGRSVRSGTVRSNAIFLDGLNNGMYFIQILDKASQYSVRFVKMK